MSSTDDANLAAIESAVMKVTADAPDQLLDLSDPAASQEFDEACEEFEADAWELVYDDDLSEAIVETDSYPRDAGMANGYTLSLRELTLASGVTIYFEGGEYGEDGIVAVARKPFSVEAAARFGKIPALPTYFHVGDDLLEIDQHLANCSPGDWLGDQILGADDGIGEWVQYPALHEAEQRLATKQEALDEALEADDIDEAEHDARYEILVTPPIWFHLLDDHELTAIADYPLPEPGRTPPLQHTIHPWTKPTAEMFSNPDDPANLQHIIAAYLLVRSRASADA